MTAQDETWDLSSIVTNDDLSSKDQLNENSVELINTASNYIDGAFISIFNRAMCRLPEQCLNMNLRVRHLVKILGNLIECNVKLS